MRLLDEDTTLELDGRTVRLRPTLRCALKIANAHGPEPADMCGRVNQGHFGMLADLLRFGAIDPDEREHALNWFAYHPLPLRRRIEHVTPALSEFTLRLCGIDPHDTAPSKGGAALSQSRALTILFEQATGNLHWTPEEVWAATPREIMHALKGRARALLDEARSHGVAVKSEPDEDEIADMALGATFDRAGFETLKIMGA